VIFRRVAAVDFGKQRVDAGVFGLHRTDDGCVVWQGCCRVELWPYLLVFSGVVQLQRCSKMAQR
jgi:hypothetical protein